LPIFFITTRFGILALAMSGLVGNTGDWVKVWDPSTWYFGYVLGGAIILGSLLLYAFFISLGEKKFFRADLLDG
jgi:hypothetical protein